MYESPRSRSTLRAAPPERHPRGIELVPLPPSFTTRPTAHTVAEVVVTTAADLRSRGEFNMKGLLFFACHSREWPTHFSSRDGCDPFSCTWPWRGSLRFLDALGQGRDEPI